MLAIIEELNFYIGSDFKREVGMSVQGASIWKQGGAQRPKPHCCGDKKNNDGCKTPPSKN